VNAPASPATVDLQVHSTASDGAVAPADIPRLAAAAGLSAFALTDHDSVAGVARALESAGSAGIRLVAGVELSAMHLDREVHILGLHIASLDVIDVTLAKFRAERAERAVMIVAKLASLGVTISIDDVRKQAADGALGRPHVARALVAAGICTDFRDAFDRFLGAGKRAFVAKPRLSVREATTLVHDSGGIAVWAHPGPEGRRETLEALARDGLDGTEVLHPGHSPDDVSRLRALCDYLKLVPSGGSDWHGEMGGSRTLGAMKVPMEWLERQDALVAARGQAGRA